jgi:hypothetical protein
VVVLLKESEEDDNSSDGADEKQGGSDKDERGLSYNTACEEGLSILLVNIR